MGLDLDALAAWLAQHPVTTLEAADALEAEKRRIRAAAPAVPNDFADVVVSNCVLNLVGTAEKGQLFDEIFRVLKKGGRAVISDIVCDETPPESMRNDPHLWSGCISGAFREDEFLERFERAGFHGIEILERTAEPWQIVEGIEFRSMARGPCGRTRASKGRASSTTRRSCTRGRGRRSWTTMGTRLFAASGWPCATRRINS